MLNTGQALKYADCVYELIRNATAMLNRK